ncbi:PspC domain-containing protein [Lapidilactobacillus bayanensis]|uniref:PspC domain-containing protein n=1 Tax=Lapidilactobacillus bayanensis TaxID=2485998 RepID=UPI000F78A097|nr:PspC domain-containing protein [Lapidilactobacillus bayanensis]
MNKRLSRSTTDRKIAGVAGGLGEYFGIDSTIIRIIFAFLFIFAGTGFIAYIILWILMPEGSASNHTFNRSGKNRSNDNWSNF